MNETTDSHKQPPFRTEASGAGALRGVAVALAAIAAASWLYLSASPPTVEHSIDSSDAVDSAAPEAPPANDPADPAIAAPPPIPSDDVAVEATDVVTYVTQLLDDGDSSQAIGFLEVRLERLEVTDIHAKAQAEWLLALSLHSAGRADEAEVHAFTAKAYADELGDEDAELSQRIAVLIEALASDEPEAENAPQPETDTSGVSVIPVSLSRDFKPFDGGMGVGATPSWFARNHRLEELPPFALQYPEYLGVRQLYGAIKLGTAKDNFYQFAFDILDSGKPLLWFDRNANYDLSDDGPPLENRGEGIFAADISLPMSDVIPAYANVGEFRIWLFTNDQLWAKGFASHYCTTVLKGRVRIAGREYDAYVADSGFNEADFTNDGLYIDLDGDGSVSRTELIPHRQALELDNGRYRFDVRW